VCRLLLICVLTVPISLAANGDTGVKRTLKDKLGAAVEQRLS
jgi:hypothetical protein